MKLKILSFLILCSICLQSCSAIGNLFGIDNTDYTSQPVKSSLELDDEKVKFLLEESKALIYGEEIITFDDFSDVYDKCCSAVLDYLATTHYGRYSASGTMFSKLAESYPELSVNTVIPSDDFKNTMYNCFGGSINIKNKSYAGYTYLDKIDAYILTGSLGKINYEAKAVSCECTENTYKLTVNYGENGNYLLIFKIVDEDRAYIYNAQKI